MHIYRNEYCIVSHGVRVDGVLCAYEAGMIEPYQIMILIAAVAAAVVAGFLLGRIGRRDLHRKARRLDHELSRSVAQNRDQSRMATRQHEEQSSVANFVLVRFPDAPGHDAKAGMKALADRGAIARDVSGAGLPGCVRITIGREKEMRVVAEALRELMS